MKDYIKLFETPEEGNEYKILDIPWTAYVNSTGQKLVCNLVNKKTINVDDVLVIVDAETMFTLIDGTQITFSGETLMPSDIADFRDEIVSVLIAPTTKNIEMKTFAGCQELRSVTILENSITKISGYMFHSSQKLSEVYIPNGIKSIEPGAFRGCESLSSIRIPGTVKHIDDEAFMTCTSLTEVYIEEGVEEIYEAFRECTSLSYINIPNSVTFVGDQAFDFCDSLQVVDSIRYADTYLVEAIDKDKTDYTIYEGTRFIGSTAFEGCKITGITIPEGVEYIYENAFSGTYLSSITLPDSVKVVGAYAFGPVSEVYIDNINHWCNINFINGIPCRYQYNLYIDGYQYSNISIPEDITKINDFAFARVGSLNSVYIPNSVTSIGSGAFSECGNLYSINIPNSVGYVATNAFTGCTGFSVENGIRYADTFLIEAVNKELSQYTIKNSTRFIGDYAFKDCVNLNVFEIPYNVTEIGYYAFEGCVSLPVEENGLRYAGTYLVGLTDNTGYIHQSEYWVKDGTTWIGKLSMAEKNQIYNIHLPSSVKIIDNYAFDNCDDLGNIDLPYGLCRIGRGAFNMYARNAQLTVEVPSTVTDIGLYAFSDVYGVAILKLYPFKNKIFGIDEESEMNVAFISVDESTFAGDFNVGDLFELGFNYTKHPFLYHVYTDNETIIRQLTETAKETSTIFDIHPLSDLVN